MTKMLSLLFFCLAMYSGSVLAQTELKIEGLKGALLDNVNAYISAIPESDYSTSLRFQSRLENDIHNALKALGYYHPSIRFSVTGQQPDQTLLLTVNAGDPVYIYVSNIEISGEAKNDIHFIDAVDNSGLNLGEVINHGKYDDLKSSLRNLALSRGYFNGKFIEHRLEIAPGRNQALIYLHYQSGQRYRFGNTTIEGSQIKEQRVRSIVPFKEGQPYLASLIGKLTQSLSNTNWFSSVYVEPNFEGIGSSKLLPMTVRLSPQVRNQLETSLGYSTDLGVNGKINWKKPWLNKDGDSLDIGLSISKPEQDVTLAYKIPLEDVLKNFYVVKYGLKRVDNRDTRSLESNLTLERHKRFDTGWRRVLYTRFLYEAFTQGIQDGHSWLVLPGISFSKSRSRGGSMPMWGDKKSFSIEATDQILTSDAKLLRLLARGVMVRSIGENHRGVARAELGAIYTDNFYKLPPSIRFFTGGGNSVRGYGYDDISPIDKNGFLTGGKYLAVSSLEYQYRVVDKWWLATFVDYGDAWLSTPNWKVGTGFGLLWASPVGPARIDFAWGLDAKPGDEFKVYFTLGPEV